MFYLQSFGKNENVSISLNILYYYLVFNNSAIQIKFKSFFGYARPTSRYLSSALQGIEEPAPQFTA